MQVKSSHSKAKVLRLGLVTEFLQSGAAYSVAELDLGSVALNRDSFALVLAVDLRSDLQGVVEPILRWRP